MALGALLALMLVVITPTLRSYLQQRSEIQELRQQQADGQERVSALEAQKKQWNDPSYVKKQAQERLGYAMPGQQITVYVDGKNTTHQVEKSTGVARDPALSKHPWYGQLWGSVATEPDAETEKK